MSDWYCEHCHKWAANEVRWMMPQEIKEARDKALRGR